MKYFVTGTTGFVGGNVARQLVEARHEVVAVVRNPAKAGDLKNLGVQKDKREGAKINIGGTRRRGGNGAMTLAHWRRG